MAQTGTVRRFDAEGWSSRGGRDTPPRSYDDPRRSAPRTAPGDATTGSGDGNGSGYRPGERWRPTQNRIAPRGAPPEAGPGGAVERAELAPLMAGDGSALPSALWAGLDVAQIEQLLAALTIPPRSPALHNLWRRLITARVDTPAGTRGNDHFDAIRLEALYRSGLIAEISEMLTADRRGDPAGVMLDDLWAGLFAGLLVVIAAGVAHGVLM